MPHPRTAPSLFYRQMEREIQQLTDRCLELEATRQQLVGERDQALAEVVARSRSIDSQQSQLSHQRMELMTERDQARSQLRLLQAELEKVIISRDPSPLDRFSRLKGKLLNAVLFAVEDIGYWIFWINNCFAQYLKFSLFSWNWSVPFLVFVDKESQDFPSVRCAYVY